MEGDAVCQGGHVRSGTVCEVNEELLEPINETPYDAWLIKVGEITEKEELLTAAEYEKFVDSEQE